MNPLPRNPGSAPGLFFNYSDEYFVRKRPENHIFYFRKYSKVINFEPFNNLLWIKPFLEERYNLIFIGFIVKLSPKNHL